VSSTEVVPPVEAEQASVEAVAIEHPVEPEALRDEPAPVVEAALEPEAPAAEAAKPAPEPEAPSSPPAATPVARDYEVVNQPPAQPKRGFWKRLVQ
jgi:hypothetical protein